MVGHRKVIKGTLTRWRWRRTVIDTIRDLRCASVEKKSKFLENGGWHCLHRWLKLWYTYKRKHLLLNSMLILLRELPVNSISKMLEDLDSPILELVEKIVNNSVRDEDTGGGTRTKSLCLKLVERWLSIYNGRLRYHKKAEQTPEEIEVDPDVEITTVFGDGEEVTLQPDVDKIWWKMTTEGRTKVVRMEEEYWMRLGEKGGGSKKMVQRKKGTGGKTKVVRNKEDYWMRLGEKRISSRKYVSARKTPAKKISPLKYYRRRSKQKRKAGYLSASSSHKASEKKTGKVSSSVTSISKTSDRNVPVLPPSQSQQPPTKKNEEAMLVVKQKEKQKRVQRQKATGGMKKVVRNKEDYWIRLGEKWISSRKYVSTRKTPAQKLPPRKLYHQRPVVQKGEKRKTKPLVIDSSDDESDKGDEKLSPSVSSKHKNSDVVAKPVSPPPSQPRKKTKENLSLEETVLVVKQRDKEKMDHEKRCKRLVEEDTTGVTFRKKIRVEEERAKVPKATNFESIESSCTSGDKRMVAGNQNRRVSNRENDSGGKSGEGFIRIPVASVKPTVHTQDKATSPPPNVAVVIRPCRPKAPRTQSTSHSNGSVTTPTENAGAQAITPKNNQISWFPSEPREANRRRQVTPIPVSSQTTTRDYGTITSHSSSSTAGHLLPVRESQPVPCRPWNTSQAWVPPPPPAAQFTSTTTSSTPPQILPKTPVSYPPPSCPPARAITLSSTQQQSLSPYDPRRASQMSTTLENNQIAWFPSDPRLASRRGDVTPIPVSSQTTSRECGTMTSLSLFNAEQLVPGREMQPSTTPENNQISWFPSDPRLASRRGGVTGIPVSSQTTTRGCGTMTSISLLNAEQLVPGREMQSVSHCPRVTSMSSSGFAGQANEPPAQHLRMMMASGTPPPPQNIPSTSVSTYSPSSFPADSAPTVSNFPFQQLSFPMDPRRSSQVTLPPIAPPHPLSQNQSASKTAARDQPFFTSEQWFPLPQPQPTSGLPLIPTYTYQSVSQGPAPRPSASTSTISSQAPAPRPSTSTSSQAPAPRPSTSTSTCSSQALTAPGFYAERSELAQASLVASSSSHPPPSASTSRDPRLATSPPRSSSAKGAKHPSIQDLPPPVPWILHKMDLTESEPSYRRRSRSPSPKSPSRSPSKHKRPMVVISTRDVRTSENSEDNTKVTDWSGIRWPEPKPEDERNPVLRIDSRRFIRKKKPTKPPVFVDVVTSPESKEREDERKRKQEDEEKRRRLEEHQNKQMDEIRKKKEEELKKKRSVFKHLALPPAPPERPKTISIRLLTTRLPTPPPSPARISTPPNSSNQFFSAVARDTKNVVSSFLTSAQDVPPGPPVETLQSLVNYSSGTHEVEPPRNPQATPTLPLTPNPQVTPTLTSNPPANLPPITPIFPPLPKDPPPAIPPPPPPPRSPPPPQSPPPSPAIIIRLPWLPPPPPPRSPAPPQSPPPPPPRSPPPPPPPPLSPAIIIRLPWLPPPLPQFLHRPGVGETQEYQGQNPYMMNSQMQHNPSTYNHNGYHAPPPP